MTRRVVLCYKRAVRFRDVAAAWTTAALCALAPDVRAQAQELEGRPPRLLAEIVRVTLGVNPRVDGDTLIGLHLGAALGQGVPPFGDGEAFGFYGLSESVFSQGLVSVHARSALAVGFGSNRIFGVSEQTLDGGLCLPMGSMPLGLYARVGLDASAFGDSRLYTSRVSLPYGRAGLQWKGQDALVELGAAGGAVIAGRFNVGDDGVRPLGGTSEIGPTLFVATEALSLSAEVRRLAAEDTGTGDPVLLARGMACGTLRGFGVGLCMQLAYGEGDVFRRDVRLDVPARSFFGGWTVGYLVE